MDERPHNEELSSLFFFLPSIMARKEKINQFHDNFDLNCTDCSLDYLNSFSFDKVDFQPHLLNCSDAEKRDLPVELLYNFFRQMGETSNVNLICNVDYFLASTKEWRDNSEIAWVGPTKQRYDSTIFKLINILIFFQKTFNKIKIVSFTVVMNLSFKFVLSKNYWYYQTIVCFEKIEQDCSWKWTVYKLLQTFKFNYWSTRPLWMFYEKTWWTNWRTFF